MTLTEESSDQRINSLIIKILVGVTMILKEVYIIVEELEDTYYWLVTKPVVNDILFDLAPIADFKGQSNETWGKEQETIARIQPT